jgi:hypothetical protein
VPLSQDLRLPYTVTAANADTYTFVITDANACTTTVTATVNLLQTLLLTLTPTQVSCFGGADGAVQLIASGGSGTGYTYSQDGITYGSVSLHRINRRRLPFMQR